MNVFIIIGILLIIALIIFMLQAKENINSLDDSIRIGAGYIAGPDYSYPDDESCQVCN